MSAIAAVISLLIASAVQQQPRDAVRAQRAGTAVIHGVVTADDSERKPLRRARVALTGPEFPIGRTVIANEDGTFAFDRLPAGRYTLTAAKNAYVSMTCGALRPGRPGTPIVIGEGERRQVTIALPRGAVITGAITDQNGQPLPGINVSAMRQRFVPIIGERRPESIGPPMVTDDRGVYRIFGLPAGDYVISATTARPFNSPFQPGEVRVLSEAEVRQALLEVRQPATGTPSSGRGQAAQSTPEPRRMVTYAPIFFPGTTVAAQAATITVGKGEERTGIDILVQYVPTANVVGVVSSPKPAQQVMVFLEPRQPTGGMGERRNAMANPNDGTFSFSGIPPGSYTVTARSASRPVAPGLPGAMMFASTEINVDGENIANVMLSLQPGLTISGRLAFEGAQPPTLDFTKIRFVLPLTLTSTGAAGVLPPPQIDGFGHFTIDGVPPGPLRIMNAIQGLRTPIGPWWLKSIAVDGGELLDRPFELRQNAENALVTFSDRASTLAGVVRNEKDAAVPDIFVVAFSTDSEAWFPNSRRVAGAKAGADGRYAIRNLPPGEYFLIATHDMEQNEWFDAEALQRLVAGSMRISIAEYEQKSTDLILR